VYIHISYAVEHGLVQSYYTFVAVGSKYDVSSYNVTVKMDVGRLLQCHWILP